MYSLDNEQLRNIIEGKTKFKHCVECNGRGYHWTDWDGNTFSSEPKEPISDDYDYNEETCEACDGLKYQEDISNGYNHRQSLPVPLQEQDIKGTNYIYWLIIALCSGVIIGETLFLLFMK